MKKVESLIYTFPTTTQAMRMEERCKALDLPGRMIPVPGEISAGCGLAWCAAPEDRAILDRMILEQGIGLEATTILLY